MTPTGKLDWSRGYLDQAILDVAFARIIYRIINRSTADSHFGSYPMHYYPAVFAYCQQSVEKALKSLLSYSTKNDLPLTHNPMQLAKRLNRNKNLVSLKKRRHSQLDSSVWKWIFDNEAVITGILEMAPGAKSGSASLYQPNTEYPFIDAKGVVRLPCEEITALDIASAMKIANYLVPKIWKYLEAQNLAPSNVLTGFD